MALVYHLTLPSEYYRPLRNFHFHIIFLLSDKLNSNAWGGISNRYLIDPVHIDNYFDIFGTGCQSTEEMLDVILTPS